MGVRLVGDVFGYFSVEYMDVILSLVMHGGQLGLGLFFDFGYVGPGVGEEGVVVAGFADDGVFYAVAAVAGYEDSSSGGKVGEFSEYVVVHFHDTIRYFPS